MIVSNSSKISNLVNAIPVNPFTLALYLPATKSNHPHLLFLPVVAPNSFPEDCNKSPSLSNSSVGNGPLPTLVTYALKIPIISFNLLPGIPKPGLIPPDEQFEEVTYGNVP